MVPGIYSVVVICMILVALAGCAKENNVGSAKNTDTTKQSVHGSDSNGTSAKPGIPIVDGLKKKKLKANSGKTIGEAFDSYSHVASKEWRETSTSSNKYYADYICWFDVKSLSPESLTEGIVKKGLELKFVIHEDGEAFITMGTRIDVKSDGKTYRSVLPLSEVATIVDAIYADKEIVF